MRFEIGSMANRHAWLVLLLIGLTACNSNYDELWRLPSPDSKVDAVFVRSSCCLASVDFSYQMFIVPHGALPPRRGERLRASDVKNLVGVWHGERQFEIRYDQARIFEFVSWWHSNDIEDGKYVVELRLAPT